MVELAGAGAVGGEMGRQHRAAQSAAAAVACGARRAQKLQVIGRMKAHVTSLVPPRGPPGLRVDAGYNVPAR
ncbi:hypothetical protein GCM10023217_13650 [Gordonia alkaliphila]|uniref:Uncharacterized protein n=1 Tax=Gordonia alkaliphila TaxID=1053547 RepID=A0ABP8Z3P7_9ACTN